MERHPNAWVGAAAVLVGFSAFQPADWVRVAAQTAAGPHPYEGVWIFIPHLLFYSTFTAAVAAACWLALVRAGAMQAPPFALSRSVAVWALAGGAISVLACLAFLPLAGLGKLTWVGFDGWKIAGNVFSNFYEEFIFRGFLLAALTALLGFWPAAVVSSLVFAFTHGQYPLSLQLFIAATSVFWCWLVRHTRSLWSAYGAHMIVDVVIDAIWA